MRGIGLGSLDLSTEYLELNLPEYLPNTSLTEQPDLRASFLLRSRPKVRPNSATRCGGCGEETLITTIEIRGVS